MAVHEFNPSFDGLDDSAVKSLLNALRGLRFGSIEVSVHEGRIVQIERREKLRVNLACPAAELPDGTSGAAIL